MSAGNGYCCSYQARGCVVRFYGWRSEAEREAARAMARAVVAAVNEAEPRAEVRVNDNDYPHLGVVVSVTLAAEDLAVFDLGPMHCKALDRVNRAAGDAAGEAYRAHTIAAAP